MVSGSVKTPPIPVYPWWESEYTVLISREDTTMHLLETSGDPLAVDLLYEQAG
ncbi:hypothetical protein ACFL6U_15800 [Planctomycetota bacterium]